MSWLESGSYRVNRGGSWFFDRPNAWVAYRARDDTGHRLYDLGVRFMRRCT